MGVSLEYGKKSISCDINLRSIDLYNSKGNNRIREGIKIGCSGLSFSSEKTVWKESNEVAIISESSFDIFGMGITHETQYDATKTSSDIWQVNLDNQSQDTDFYFDLPVSDALNADLSFLIGIDFKINLKDFLNGIKELFSN